ncbi:hypothetical protein PMI16_04719 [Herbaspirillum sp. CF444]|uniref:methyltransferase, TIGR04325 family n=1 Tax=Herbaspirillum sp. CF444 TaxID=1144319 RepID=UPI0002723446|nr:methyltransferase, TIGR04325 family [Herbaspirillum sp. CF444]EJL81440.1 hypothetical protein PMI16_04719 [Herbaspirillum sp. CF444]
MIGKSLKRLLKNCIPPGAMAIRHFFSRSRIRFVGHFASWEAAAGASKGYDDSRILEQVSNALMQVKSGKAIYERDSVLFDEVHHSFPLLAGLLRVAVENGGQLTVLDFGGSLGSSYFQCKHFLPDSVALTWCVVEQEKFVQRGRDAFATDELQFFFSIEECLAQHRPHVVLFASVLQYLEKADQILDSVVAASIPYVLIDRTPFIARQDDWICVQEVPASIYEASYPCALLSSERLVRRFSADYHLIADFEALGGDGYVQTGIRMFPFEYRGMIWRRY